ncbi:hypothetical protein [Streptomyces cacaoi]|uniref:hypothetical protein n=1 Tax=Streptomyces cacaoi TaxID=1898 RepID=UPI0037485D21
MFALWNHPTVLTVLLLALILLAALALLALLAAGGRTAEPAEHSGERAAACMCPQQLGEGERTRRNASRASTPGLAAADEAAASGG